MNCDDMKEMVEYYQKQWLAEHRTCADGLRMRARFLPLARKLEISLVLSWLEARNGTGIWVFILIPWFLNNLESQFLRGERYKD